MKLILPSILVLVSCSGIDANAVDTPETSARLGEARALLDRGQYDDALLVTDAILKSNPSSRNAHLLAADANLALLESGRSGQQFFLLDAINHLEQATELDTHDGATWLRLADARLKNSEFEEGAQAAERALREFQRAEADDALQASAALGVANNCMQMFVDLRRPEIEAEARRPEDATMAAANRTLRAFDAAMTLGAHGPASLGIARVCRWLDRDMEALEALERGILADPTLWELHEEFRAVYDSTGNPRACVGAYNRLLRAHNDNPGLLFYLGRAQISLGDQLRDKSQWDDAITEYGKAATTFEKCGSVEPDFATNCAKNRALCVLSIGRIEYERGNLDAALTKTEESFGVSPAVANYDENLRPELYHSLNGNYLGNLCMIGGKLIETRGLDAGLAHYERILERHAPLFGATIYNNAALCARDLGVEVAGNEEGERDDNLARAMELWEKSYRYYNEAVRRAPDDARIVNDCGLILVYHLHREYDRARELFDHAIEVGQAELDALPENTPGSRRQDLEEAVGDAWQNIGVLLEQLGRPASEIAPYHERAVKYYPYRQRSAQAWIDSQSDVREATFRPQDPRKKSFDVKIREAAAKADAEDFDSALLVMDKMAKEMNGYAPFHYHFGLYSLRYGQAAQRDGGNAGLINGLYADAVNQLGRAMEIDAKSSEIRVTLAEACMATGEFGRALEAVSGLSGDAADDDKALSMRAQAAGRVYVAAKGESRDDADALKAARESFTALEKSRPLTAAERGLWVNVERWDGKSKNAIEILLRAARKNPDDQATLNDLVTIGAQIQEADKVVGFLKDRKDALGLWYAGRSRYDLALHQWTGSETGKSRKTLDDAVAAFDGSAAANADYKASCQQWSAFCLGLRGLVELADDDHQAAHGSLIGALQRHPGALTSNLGSSNIKTGLLFVGDRYLRAGKLGDVADLYIEIGKLAPNDVDLANNEGLFCRDHADAMRRGGASEKERMPYYEASYAAYTRANQADPANVRLRNDRALILVYHLKRELDTARELLVTGAADGEVMLKESPPEDAAERRNLEEAVGDCYENLGLYWIEFGKDPKKAREALEKSLEFYPGQRRPGTRRHLRRLERGDDK